MIFHDFGVIGNVAHDRYVLHQLRHKGLTSEPVMLSAPLCFFEESYKVNFYVGVEHAKQNFISYPVLGVVKIFRL